MEIVKTEFFLFLASVSRREDFSMRSGIWELENNELSY